MKKFFSLTIVSLTLVLATAGSLFADEYKVGDLTISDVWSRASPSVAKAGAVYMTITNNGSEMEMVSGVSSPMAGKAMLHETKMVDGVMKMEHAMHVMIKPGGTLKLAPGGFHVMLMKLTGELTDGTVFPLTMEFKNSGTVVLQVNVKKSGS